MAETKFIQYGDKKMPLGELTLEQAKETMARYFPELADPKVETKKNGDEVTYVFSKKAGTKGGDLDRVARSLLKRKPVAVVPPPALRLALALNGGTWEAVQVERNAAYDLDQEAQRVSEVCERLLRVEPAGVLGEVVLL